jgi:hypothetical protein
MLTRLKTYLHELVSDKKNWLILLPAISAYNNIFTMFYRDNVDDYIANTLVSLFNILFNLPLTYSYTSDKLNYLNTKVLCYNG